MRVPLQYPFELDGVNYDAVTLRRMKAKDMRVLGKYKSTFQALRDRVAAKDGAPEDEAPKAASVEDVGADDIEATIALVASITDLPVKVIDELDVEDLGAISAKIEDFFTSATPTNGGQSSPTSRRS